MEIRFSEDGMIVPSPTNDNIIGVSKSKINEVVGSSTTPTAVPQLEESAGHRIVQKLRREAYVSLLDQTASSVEMSATVLPTLVLDPRDNRGKELVRISNGSQFAGEYLLTEVITTYSEGKRSRSISGIATRVDGLSIVPIDDLLAGLSTSNLGGETSDVGAPSAATPVGQKPIEDAANSVFDLVKKIWTTVTK